MKNYNCTKKMIHLFYLMSLACAHLLSNPTEQLETPVLLIIFKRPEHQQKVFEEIKAVRPTKLFIVADGPRKHVPSDKEKCEKARAIIQQVDWPCEVKTSFSAINKGPDQTVSAAVSWVLEQESECIVLEDDCKPSTAFFFFCQKMLEYYRDDQRVFHVGGNLTWVVHEKSYKESQAPYCFHHFMNCWGWATWRRAWDCYRRDIKNIRNIFSSINLNQWVHPINARMIQDIKRYNTWDVQWFHIILQNKGLCISPKVNLIENVGFDKESTHTSVKFGEHTIADFDWKKLPRL